MAKLTKRTVDALKPKSASYFEWDDELRGFGVRVSPKGAKSFVVQYRAGGRSRRLKIGRYGTLAADEARTKARGLLGDVADGGNPAEQVSVRRGSRSRRCTPKEADVHDIHVAGSGHRCRESRDTHVAQT